MTQDLMAIARQGDAHAIARLINRSLQPKGITAKVALRDGCLKVMLESESIPDQSALALYIYKGLASLDIDSIQALVVYGRQTGDEFPSWTQEFSFSPFGALEPQFEPQPQVVVPAQPQPASLGVCCPRCKSTQVMVGQKKFSVGNAAAGFILLGPLGLLGGAIGRDRVSLSCIHCGYVWEPHKTKPVQQQPTPSHAPAQPTFAPRVISAKKFTPAKLYQPSMSDRAGRAGASFLGLSFMSLLLGSVPLLAIPCFLGGVLLAVWFLMVDGTALAVWKGSCPYCNKNIQASHDKTGMVCVHCKGEIVIKSQRFFSVEN